LRRRLHAVVMPRTGHGRTGHNLFLQLEHFGLF
jgi:hypothetical protein